MKKLYLLIAFALCVFCAGAQNTRVVTGAVIDKNGNTLANALVEATGGAQSTTTDAEGAFRLEVPYWLKSITARYAGMPDKTVRLTNKSYVIFEMEPNNNCWFLDLAGSLNFGEVTFGRAGLMGGYLGNWGGYAKVIIPFGHWIENWCPAVTLGGIKKIAGPAYLYLGAGYTPVFGQEYVGWDVYDDYEDGGIFEIGAIFRFKKINFSLGYAYSSSFCCYENHSVQFSVGYCF